MVHDIQIRERGTKFLHSGDFGKAKVLCNLFHWALSIDEHMLVVELLEHLQWTMGHHHLFFIHLKTTVAYKQNWNLLF